VLTDFVTTAAPPIGVLEIIDVPLAARVEPGRLDPRNSPYVLALLDRAADGCMRGEFSAMVTAPLQKSVINDAGVAFIGHTEYLAERLAAEHVVMMLAGGGLRVALATTHLALKDVPRAITRESLTATLRVLERDLRVRFGLPRPKIVVAGLNPHAGESGHMGREEIDVIEPVLHALRAENFDLIGPTPADTLFHPAHLRGVDAVLAMFHDQGLPVLKFASFGQGVNITLGLPIVRTSVDHGTALALAGRVNVEGQALADPSSLGTAIEVAIQMCLGSSKAGAESRPDRSV
jgi:4-hydroxythreonine-4-phosphate dehydrogenase